MKRSVPCYKSKLAVLGVLCMAAFTCLPCRSFTLHMMARPKRGNLKKVLEDAGATGSGASKGVKSLNQGRGQEITGVTLPADGSIKGWEFAKGMKVACANVNGQYYAVQGDCPRCAFDLFKGPLITDGEAFQDVPRVACPTCSTTFSFKNGTPGPPLKQKGLAGFVGNLAKTATAESAGKPATAFLITRDETDGRVYCRER
jgi:nitrite reductase/ring-hydroxylating ferredoxin subunit